MSIEDKLMSSVLGGDADWLPKAFSQAQIHIKLLLAVGPDELKFSPLDEAIYQSFRREFPIFEVGLVEDDLHEAMQTGNASKQWIDWVLEWKDKVKDWDQGSLLRKDPNQDYISGNTTFCIRIQFLAIEIARNKEKFNHKIVEEAQKQASGSSGGCCSRC
ncbi:unnamed protein product [Oikopleura dioica]|uniref:Polysaccharide biosynthesis domain-containing protein n=1 Tax=Oikopleura dioica TaxID=34765 RepID=E4Z539_OIKDI|nr:unnamed protein product [Oikopleura dioica]